MCSTLRFCGGTITTSNGGTRVDDHFPRPDDEPREQDDRTEADHQPLDGGLRVQEMNKAAVGCWPLSLTGGLVAMAWLDRSYRWY